MPNPSIDFIDSVAALVTETEATMSTGSHVAAVLDPASHPGVWARYGVLAGARGGGSLFIGTSHPDDTAVAPLLLPLQRDDAVLQKELVRIARTSPAVIWLASPLRPEPLAVMLAAKLHASLADGLAITLRYHDPRVLPELLAVFHADQAASFHEGIADWWWFDRDNVLCGNHPEPPGPAASTAPPWLPAIVLDEQQVEALLDASFVDRVLDVLQRIIPGAWQVSERACRYRAASRLTEAAALWNLSSEFDCASYIAVALQLGPDFAWESEWAKAMEEVKAGGLRFSDAIANWEQRRAGSMKTMPGK